MMDNSKIEIRKILDLLPHRFPFLLVDKVIELKKGNSIVAVKNVTINEPFFQGHFPSYPVMPGVLIVEAMAQAGGILIIKSFPNIPTDKLFFFSGIEKVRFRRPVFPGDQLILKAYYIKHKLNIWKMKTEAYVDDKLTTDGILTAALVDKGD